MRKNPINYASVVTNICVHGKNKNQNTTRLVSVVRTQVYKRQSPGMPVHQEFCHVSKFVKA